jgi:hypothetical protein
MLVKQATKLVRQSSPSANRSPQSASASAVAGEALAKAAAIIIVTFQNAGEIAACLRSLIAAEPQRRVFLFLIDNASTDATRQIIKATINDLPKPRFRVDLILNDENLGFTRAVNQGLQRYFAASDAKDAPVLFLNPDTVAPADSLALLLEKLYVFPDAGVIAPQLVHTDGRIQSSCRRFPRQWDLFCELSGLSRLFPNSPHLNRWKMGDFDHQHAMEVDQPQGACLLAKPEVVQQVGKWDERFPIFFSDVDWCRRAKEKGWKIRFEPAVQVMHAQGVSVRQVRPAAIWSSHLSFWRYLRKYENNWREKISDLIFGPLLVIAALVRLSAYFLKNIFAVNAP